MLPDENDLARRLVRHVADEADPEALLALGGVTDAARILGLGKHAWQRLQQGGGTFANLREAMTGSPRKRLFSGWRIEDPGFVLRLGQVYEAASPPAGRTRSELLRQEAPWLACFLEEAYGGSLYYGGHEKTHPHLDARVVEEALALGDQPPDLFLRALFALPADADAAWTLMTGVEGIGAALERHREDTLEALRSSHARGKIRLLELLGTEQVAIDPYLETVVGLSAGSAKTVREAAAPVLRAHRAGSIPLLERLAETGKPTEREQAVRRLWELAREDAIPFLERRRDEDSSKKVQDALAVVLAGKTGQATATGEPPRAFAWAIPRLPPLAPPTPPGEETRRAFEAIGRAWNDHARQAIARSKKQGWQIHIQEIPARSIPKMWEAIARTTIAPDDAARCAKLVPRWHAYSCDRAVRTFLERPDLEPVHAVRALVLFGEIAADVERLDHVIRRDAYLQTYRRAHDSLGLAELARTFRTMGLPAEAVAVHVVDGWDGVRLAWGSEAVWPYFAEHFPILDQALGRTQGIPSLFHRDYWAGERRRNALRVLAGFPTLPPDVIAFLWELALGTAKVDRALARSCLEGQSDRRAKLEAALGSGKQDVRAVAAEWLGSIGATDSIPALRRALAKEKREIAQGAMLVALEALGEPLDDLVNPEKLAAEAEKGLAKGLPKGVTWFPFDQLPEVRWGSGDVVDPASIRWLVARSHKLRSPDPGPLLRRYTALMEPGGREDLGRFVIETWLTRDTRPRYATRDAALPEATRRAQQITRWQQRAGRPSPPLEQLLEEQVREVIKEIDGSATADRGVLAVTAAIGGSTWIPAVERYLSTWYGQRASQCKALLQTLSWNDDPLAVQLLLSVARRFRTKSIQEEAGRLVDAVAERKGWTPDELADRTIPTGGLDDEHAGRPAMILDYGSRRFTITLDASLTPVITTEEGKTIKSLPAPRAADDPDLAKAAKKRLTATRKELKQVVRHQHERLYEAMCTERTWTRADWSRFLLGHPVVGSLGQRLVWMARDPAGAEHLVRPLEDGTLTDVEDEPVELDPGSTVRLVHGSRIPAGAREAWRRHLADYEVDPLFDQLREGGFELADRQKRDTSVETFQGHLVEAFQLRGRAGKLGYVRGPSEDGGWFYTYRKSFPGLRLDAVIEFTGNVVPEENRIVALRNLSFERKARESEERSGWGHPALPLEEVPPVILGECWNDMRLMAADGPGFDPDWETKSEW